jgi:amino acid adenylation domain-containing protein
MSVDLREKRLRSLSPAKRALLLEALRRKEGQGRQEPRIPRRAETGHAPLSFAQERLWFLDQLEPGRALYNLPMALRVEGPLEVRALALCLGEIVRRHEALRTIFGMRADGPVQLVQPAAPFELPVVDLSQLPEMAREATAFRLAGEEAGRAFDLARGPLLRGLLLRLASPEDPPVHAALLTMHHITGDGWSMGILVREVAALYPAVAEGRPSPLPELPVQYGDFAAWQRSGPYHELLESEVSFWRRQLAGLPLLLELPTDRPRPATQSYRGATRPVLLPPGLARLAEALARREGATMFMVLLAGFQALLARHSGQDDLGVGTPVAGRNRLDIERLIGFFVNTLVLRGDLSGKPAFRELLGRVRETALAAYAHQDVPFERLVQELAPERSLAHLSLFQVMLALQNAPVESLEIRDLRLRAMAVAGTTAKFDLTLTLEEHDGGLYGTVEYATDLFDGTTIDRLIAGFERLLAAASTAPERSIPELPFLDEAERWQILGEWNDTCAEGLAEGCLHQHVAAQAARTPEAVAVELGDERWTYRRLIGGARRLARHLRELGVGPDVIVGLAAERSPAMVAAMLAVLEAGGAWLPLDPAYPADRLAFMLDDSGARVLLIQEHLLPRVPAAGRSVVLLDGRWDAGEQGEEPAGDLGAEVMPDHLAYVIYTSGSTGRPKGVMVPHRGVVNRLRWAQRIYRLGPGDAVLQKASFSFDFSVWECFAPLAAGARLVLAEPGLQGDGAYLVRALRGHRVTFVHFVPSMLAAFLGEEGVETCTSLRQVFSGGEALTPELRDRALARLPAPLDNQYGPTEISIDTTRWVCAPGQDPHRVPIGRPIANSRFFVVDPELRPLPVGVAGELLVGGPGVTRGYLGMPALTAERFVPDPFAVEPGARLYRTGDLVRWTRAGHLEFVGRIDQQVKMRGFRIELGEIEAALTCHPRVLEGVVVLREDRPGDQRLVAYVVAAGGATLETAELRPFLRHSLPEFMVPATFVNLTSMPLSPNGKVDRRSLPRPVDGAERKGEYLAPRTPIEELLAGIWSDLLQVEGIGGNDDFFELGGHSLQGIRLVARIREVLGVDLPVRALFQAPTLAALAAVLTDEILRRAEPGSDAGDSATGRELAGDRLTSVIARLQENQSSLDGTRIRPIEEREGPLPLSFAQERLWFLEQLEPGTAFYNIPGAVRIKGELRFAVLIASLEEVTRRHESLRTTFGELAGQPYQRVGADSRWTVPIVDLTALPPAGREAELRQLATGESRRPFDLARGPLMRVVLFRLGPRDQVIVFTTHHIISDGWSALVFLREIAALYAALSTGRPALLPPLPVQYVDYAVWQRTYLAGSVLEAQLAYWRDRLAGVSSLELPTDRPRPAIESFRGGSHPVGLPQETGRALLALSRREGATLFMTLLALFKTLLLRYSGQTDLVVGSPIANRNRSEVERVIGFFANTVVLRTDLHGDPSFRELLLRVREVALGAYAHEDLPFERIVEELQPERDMSRNPLFQVMCVLQNQPQETLPAGDLRMSPLAIELAIAKFDLTLFWYEEQGWISGQLEYNTDLFDRSTALRFYRHYERLLEAVLADPGRPLSSLPLLGDAERHQIASEWSDTAAVAEDRCVHTWVEAQVERMPESIAAVFGDQRLSYRELNLRANRLAHGLIRHGVGPESLVGICVDRSLEMVVAALAVLKAGGALVALDPAYPHERLATIIEDAGLAILLTQEPLLRQFPKHRNIALCLASGVEPFPLESGENPRIALVPDHPMYVIYTSGSTGQPKGIVVTHRAFANLASWQLGNSPLADGLRTVQFAAFGFCVSFQEIFSAWCSGGTLVVADDMTRRDSERLVELLASEGIDRLHLPFAALKQLADVREIFARLPMQLTEIITAGEQLRVTPAVRDLLEQLPGCSLHNQYGASETHVVCELALRGSAAAWPAIPSVGRPIRNVRIHLLDAQLEPVPIGVRGSLYAAGACLARAYLNDPVLTAQKMVPDPFAREPGSRLYRTGDLARHLRDGQIEFLGRADGQVKIRGFRVELGEVETALVSHPRVRDAVAIAQPMEAVGLQLVAYVVGAEGDLALEELRGYLKQRLPEYMVPSVFVQLEALPVTANGKLDQAALPVPEAGGGSAGSVAPRTLTEELLAALWAEVLHRERVGATDNFFEIGGHSLLATQVVSRARSAFGVELPVRALFEAPTVMELANRIEKMRRGGKAALAPPIRPVPRDRDLPLSFAQQRLWFIDQLEPGGSSYNLAVALRVEGPLDPSALARSFQEIVRRHEILRTTFSGRGGEPVQIIQPAVPFPLALVDLSALPEPARQEQAAHLAAEEARRPFDLTRDPLLRCALLRLNENAHVLALTLHHIAADGWSAAILTREIGVAYRAIREGRRPELPPLPVQYVDFAVWQRSWLTGETLASQLAWWRETLAGAPTLLDLPTDRPRRAIQHQAGAVEVVELAAAGYQRMVAAARQADATPFMLLLATFGAFLGSLTGLEDLLVGIPVAGRNRPELEGLIGLFLNTLLVRQDLSGDPDFQTLLRRVRDASLEAYARQDLPFDRLVEELNPERDLTRAPLYQVQLNLLNVPRAEIDFSEGVAAAFPLAEVQAKLDLAVYAEEAAGRLALRWIYDARLFDAATIRRAVSHFVRLLEAAVEEPRRRLSELPLLTAEEVQQIRFEWNDTHPAHPPGSTIPERFFAAAERWPERIALSLAEEALTYGELASRVRRRAAELKLRGVGPETMTALCFERSFVMVEAVLAVLVAGGAYAALDPHHPRSVLESVLRDVGPALLLTQEHLRASLPLRDGMETLALDRREGSLGSERALPAPPDPQSLAYVAFTSGSTGAPKGILGVHGSVMNYLSYLDEVWPLSPEDQVLQLARLSFDASIRDLLYPLTRGAGVVLPAGWEARDPSALLREIRRRGVTCVLGAVPSLLHALMEAAVPGEDGRHLRLILASGEPLPLALCQQLSQQFRGVRIANQYGPSECTLTSTLYQVPSGISEPGMAPAGRPISGLRCRVLDSRLREAPVGVAGQIFLGGLGVTRGYLNRPDLTAERFLPDPFSSEPGERLYATGDLGRQRPEGALEVLGRLDHQVKIRGIRLELGEVEAMLAAHPEISRAVTTVREGRLVAYVVGRGGLPPGTGLRGFLEERLPEHAVPSLVIPLDSLPLNANGKVDRGALPAPGDRSRAAAIAPRDVQELQLVSIWEKILDVHPVGVTDDFFELGGHSLLAVRLLSLIERQLGRRLPLAALFQARTVERLAACLREREPAAPSSLVPLREGEGETPRFWVHPVGGTVFSYLELAAHLAPEGPFFAFQAPGLAGERPPLESIDALAAHYLVELRAARPSGPYRLGGWSLGGVVAFEMARLLRETGEEVEELVLVDSRTQVPEAEDGDELELWAGFAGEIGLTDSRAEGGTSRLELGELLRSGSEMRLQILLDQTRQAGLLPPDAAAQDLAALFGVFAAGQRALRSHRPRPYAGPVLFFQAAIGGDRAIGWKNLVEGGLEVVTLPGDHRTMMRGEGARLLAQRLSRAALARTPAHLQPDRGPSPDALTRSAG